VIVDPQVVHNQAIEIWDHPDAGKIQQPRPAARFSETPAEFPKSAAHRGQHNDEILAEIGHTPAQIEALRDAGIIGG
jgi:alpha-methylacyl-CoA racemase